MVEFLFSFYLLINIVRLTFSFGHFFGESLFALFFDIANTSGTVRIKQECEHLAYPIGKQSAFLYVMRAFCANIELVFLAA